MPNDQLARDLASRGGLVDTRSGEAVQVLVGNLTPPNQVYRLTSADLAEMGVTILPKAGEVPGPQVDGGILSC